MRFPATDTVPQNFDGTASVPRTYLFHGSSAVTNLATILHVVAGTVGLLAGIIAVSSRKGARVHRVVGTLFCVSSLAVLIFWMVRVRFTLSWYKDLAPN